MIVYGPVPSRRLGNSMGINNIPPKICSYSCVYCQLGRTNKLQMALETFYEPEFVFQQVQKKVAEVKENGHKIDYLTFVADGEPTLDVHLGKLIGMLRKLGIKIAVISNASLLDKEHVKGALSQCDWVSLKVDAVSEPIWRKVNRPYSKLKLAKIFESIQQFADSFKGTLVTETMLIKGINDGTQELMAIVDFLSEVQPSVAYLAVPTRPPAEHSAVAPEEEKLMVAYHIFREKLKTMELLIGYEGNAFAFSGDVEADLLSITAVHPMREDAVQKLLQNAGSNWSVVRRLIQEEKLLEIYFEGHRFFMRKLYRKSQ